MVRAGLMAYPSVAVDSCLFAHDDIVNTHDNSRRAPGINPSKQNDSRSNYISCSKAHRRFSYGFQRHYNDFMTENTIAHQRNLEVVTQRNGRECWVENCASLTDARGTDAGRDVVAVRPGEDVATVRARECHQTNMAVLCFETSVESGVFAQVVQLCQITCDFDIGMIRKWMKRVIKCAKHDEYAFYRVVGPLMIKKSAGWSFHFVFFYDHIRQWYVLF